MIKVTIIIPVYNSEKYINRCLDSIFGQTYKNIEVIVLNDGSTDNSLFKLKEYKKRHRDLIIIDKKNEGVSITRNKGIELATGEYIMFVDNDDYLEKDYINKYVAELDDDYDIIIGGYKRTNSDNKVMFKSNLTPNKWAKYLVMAPWAKLYKLSFIKNNNIEFLSYGIGEDVYFNLLAYSKNPKIKIIKYKGYNWYYNSLSVSNTNQRGFKKNTDIIYLLNKLNKIYKKPDKMMKCYYNRYVIWYLLFSGKNSNPIDFIKEYNRLNEWLVINNLKINFNPFLHDFKGDTFKNKLFIVFFQMIEKFNMMNIFSKIYCKNNELNDKKINIFIGIFKKCEIPSNKIYIPLQLGAEGKENLLYQRDNDGENISSKNANYCELSGLYWIWKNVNVDIVGLVHYRRFFFKNQFYHKFKSVLKEKDIKKILQRSDVIVSKKVKILHGTVREQYGQMHHIKDYDMCRKIIKKKYPDYIQAFDIVSDRNYFYAYNMCIMNKEQLNNYCKWLFDILFELESKVDISNYSNYDKRIYGFLSERLFNVWLVKNKNLKIKELYVYNTEQSFLKQYFINFIKNIMIRK